MKKSLSILAVALFFGAMFTSCSKEYVCECTVSGIGEDVVTSTTMEGKKDDVKTACEQETTMLGITTKCVVK